MTRLGLLALGATATAVSVFGAGPLRAERADARLDVTARFDRRTVQPGQIAVADVDVRLRGPAPGGRVTLTLAGAGGTIVRTRARGARCGRPDRAQRVRCTVGAHAAGTTAAIVVQLRPETAARSVRLTAFASPSGSTRAVTTIRVAATPTSALAELSFVLETPSVVTVGRSFPARVRLLNRGPGRTLVGPITLTSSPSAQVTLPRLPRQLRAGEEPTFAAHVTPLRAGRLVLDLRVGQGGRARLGLSVRAAAP
jgi:hypothetical protein